MASAWVPTTWANLPAGGTALNATNLNDLEARAGLAFAGLGAARIVALGNLGVLSNVTLLSTDSEVWITGTMIQDCLIALTGLLTGVPVRLLITNDATGGWALSISAGGSTANAPIATSANAASVVDAFFDGTDLYVRGAGT